MAMSANELNERIGKCEEKISKIQKRIDKWQGKKCEDAYVKDKAPWWTRDYKLVKTMDDLKRVRSIYFGDTTTQEENEKYIARDYLDYLNNCDNEIKYANRDLQDVKNTLNKYKNALALISEKENKPIIKIFKDFFDNWKKEIIEYVKPLVDKYYELSSEYSRLHNNRYLIIGDGREFATKEDWEVAIKDVEVKERKIGNIPWVKIAIDKNLRISDDEFNTFLDKYMIDRYYELVDKVTDIVGEINDVSNLRVGYDGRLNGVVIGTTGKANLETIIAGGENEDIIVNVKHGQCRHYRVLVHEMK